MKENPYTNLPDEELMEFYQDGESMAFEVLYTRYKKRVYSYLYKRVYDKDKIDDIFQKLSLKMTFELRLISK